MITWKDFAVAILSSSYIKDDHLIYDYSFIDSGIDFDRKLASLTDQQHKDLDVLIKQAINNHNNYLKEVSSWISKRNVTDAVLLEFICWAAFGTRLPPKWVILHQEEGTWRDAIHILCFSIPRSVQLALRERINNKCWRYRYNKRSLSRC